MFPRWLGVVAAVSAVGGGAAAMLSVGTAVPPPLVLDLGSFLPACLFMTAVSVHALRRPASA